MRKLLFGLLGLLWVLPVMAVDYSNCQNLFDGEYISVNGGGKAENANNFYVSPGERYVAFWTTSLSSAVNLYEYDTQGNQVGSWTSGHYASNDVSTPFSDNYMAWQSGAVFTVPDGVAYLRFNTFGSLSASQQQAWAESLKIYNMDCVEKITIASTKYIETQFSALNTALANAVATVNTVVTQTIAQAASIATLQSGKQTRPDETCPAGKKCLLVTDENNIPHWYEIVENAWDLPVGYTQLEYIESTGTQYIDTNIIASSTKYKVETRFAKGLSSSAVLGNQSGDALIYISGNSLVIYVDGMQKVSTSLGDTDSHVVSLEYNDTTVTLSGDYTGTFTTTWNPVRKIDLFANNYNGNHVDRGQIKMYYAKFWNNDVLVRNFIPAKNPDGKIGMYDLVGGRFYENAGEGSFIAGPVAE